MASCGDDGVVKFQKSLPGGFAEICTQKAITVYVKAEVHEILDVCQVSENFVVTFGLDFYYVDAELSTFQTTMILRDGGSRRGQIVEHPLYSNSGNYVLKQDDGSLFSASPDKVAHIGDPEWGKDTHFKVSFTMPNMVEEAVTLMHQRKLEYCSSNGGHIVERFKYLATFREKLELHNMPFDRQMFQMEFEAEEPQYVFQFQPLNINAGSLARRGGYSVPAAWVPESPADGLEPAVLQVTKPEHSGNSSSFQIVVHLRRCSQFYVFNVILMVFCLTSSMAEVFMIPAHKIDARAPVSLALLLATVAYKLTLSGWIPVKEYLTFLDIYLLCSFIFQFLAIAENILVAGCYSEDGEARPYSGSLERWTQVCYNADEFDSGFAQILFGLWIGWHVVFMFWHNFAFRSFYFAFWLLRLPYRVFNAISAKVHQTCAAEGAIGRRLAPLNPCWETCAMHLPWRSPGESWQEVYSKNDFPRARYYQQPCTENPFTSSVVVQPTTLRPPLRSEEALGQRATELSKRLLANHD